MDILYAIIYGIMVFKYQIIGKMNSIKILKGMNMEIEHKHFMMLWMEEYQIKKIIIILIYKMKMEKL